MRVSTQTQRTCSCLIFCAALSQMGECFAQPAPPVPPTFELKRTSLGGDVAGGVVSQYLLNPRGEVDGLFFSNGMQIHFPPHMSAQLLKAVKPGDRVVATGSRQNSCVLTAHQILVEKSKAVIVDSGPPHAPVPSPTLPTVRSLKVQSRVKAYLYGPRGDVNGFLLSDETIVRMPPETAFNISNIFKPGQVMVVQGSGCESSLGRCIEATGIGTEGQPIISIYDRPKNSSEK